MVDAGAVEFSGKSDLADLWNLDWDGDGSSFGVEFTLGTDPFVADLGSPRNLRIAFESGGIRTMSFGINPIAEDFAAWALERSRDLEHFEQIYLYDPLNRNEASSPEVMFFRTSNAVFFMLDPGATGEFFRFVPLVR